MFNLGLNLLVVDRKLDLLIGGRGCAEFRIPLWMNLIDWFSRSLNVYE